MRTPGYDNVEEVGVDDWAWRKGVTYGSIIIDYTNGWPIDLLGDRDTESFREWIEQHKNVHTVSRDRSTDYSSAIASTGRQINEVADKFHLVKNITDRTTKLVAENYADYRQAVRSGEKDPVNTKEATKTPLSTDCLSQKPDSREVMFNEVKELQRKGFKPTPIAKKLGIARQTATKYCKMDSLPERNSKLRNEYYKYDTYVEQEAASGKSLSVIHQEICQMGFSGSLTPFYDHYKYLSDGHRGYRSKNWKPDTKKEKPQDDRSELLPVKAIASVIDKALKGRDMDESQRITFDALMSLGWFKEMYEAMEGFCKVIKGNETVELVRWMKRYWKTGIQSLKTFIIGIKRDFQAVRNTIRLNVTNGMTEGFVNKLKVVKRSMYGRAGLELLKNKLVLGHILFN
jgi:predicted transcriptional regulator